MNRIDRIFNDLRGGGRTALMPYLTAGDPDVATTGRLIDAAADAGAAVCEVGIPFSDPVADGPVIEASMTHALAQGVTVAQVFETIAAARRRRPDLGLVAMLSYSIVYRIGLEKFVDQAKGAGFDGFIFPDLPLEESAEAVEAVRDAGMILSMLIAPQTEDERVRRIAESCSGFVYVLSRAGITGERDKLPAELSQRVRHLRSVTKLPIAVGFGIASPQHVKDVTAVADAAIVGSAVMRRVAEHRGRGPDAVVEVAGAFIADLARGLSGGGPAVA